MSNWVVVYRVSPGMKEVHSPAAPSDRRALAQARTLHLQGCEVLRIIGPDKTNLSDDRIDSWIANGRDRMLAE